jgi:predicted TIM-barrel fold metal-dependent hydrolase
MLFDSHFHLIDPRFPLTANQGFLPGQFLVADYRRALAGLPVTGGAVVAGSFQGFDQSWLAAALAALGRRFVGVAQLPTAAADAEILRLHAVGVRAVRFNLHRGEVPELSDLETLARRVHDLAGWHAEFYLDAADLPALRPLLARLPRIVIDHLGLSRAGLPHVLDLVAAGAWVKASGFARLDFPAATAIAQIDRENPAALLFGTDLPGTRAPRPFAPADLDLIARTLGSEAAVQRVCHDNAAALYLQRG